MKSLLMISPWLGIKDRGAETFAKELSEELAKSFKVTLVTGRECKVKNIDENIVFTGFRKTLFLIFIEKIYFSIARLSSRNIYGLFFNFVRRVWDRVYFCHPEVLYQRSYMKYVDKELKTRKWDVIFPQNGIHGVKWALKQKEKYNSKVIYTGHGGIGRSEQLIIDAGVDQYISISRQAYDWAKLKSDSVTHIYNGVNIEMFEGANLNKRKSEIIKVLSVGALTNFKRHELTIKAISLIPNAHLRIIGDGELKDELIAMAETYIPGRFVFERIDYTEMKQAYATADIFVLPSQNEPMGIVYVEALVSGIKVVAPDDIVRREVLDEFGYYVDVTSKEQYSTKILEAYHSDYNNLSAIEYCKKKFSWESISNSYKKLLSK